jgi:hypothetical protein
MKIESGKFFVDKQISFMTEPELSKNMFMAVQLFSFFSFIFIEIEELSDALGILFALNRNGRFFNTFYFLGN